MKTKKILALWAVGMLSILTIFCYGQGHTIRQFPTTNQLANADAFVVELGTGTTNMNVTKANMPAALGVPTLAQMLTATNDSFAYAFSLSNRVVTSAGTAIVSNNLTASNVWDRSNVKWWGATGNGSTVDTLSFSNAMVWAGGNQIRVPAGTYVISNWAVNRDLFLALDEGAILKHASAAAQDMIAWTGTNLTVIGGSIDGNLAGQTGRYYIFSGNCQSNKLIRILECKIKNTVHALLHIDTFGGLIDVQNCTFTGQAENDGTPGNETAIMFIASGETGAKGLLRFNHNRAIGNVPAAVDGGSPGGIFFCTRTNTPTDYTVGNSSTLEAVGNYFYGYGQNAGGSDISPIHFYPVVAGARIVGNYFEKCGFCAISLKSVIDAVVTDNVIVNGQTTTANVASEGAISYVSGYMAGSSSRPRAVIANNIVDTPGGETGVGKQSCITIRGTSTNGSFATGWIVANNVLKSGGYGLYLDYVDTGSILGNEIEPAIDGTAGTELGIIIYHATNGVIRIQENHIITGNGDGLIGNVGLTNCSFEIMGNRFDHSAAGKYACTIRGAKYAKYSGNTWNITAGVGPSFSTDASGNMNHYVVWDHNNSFQSGSLSMDVSTIAKLTGAFLDLTGKTGLGTNTPVGTMHIVGVSNSPALLVSRTNAASSIDLILTNGSVGIGGLPASGYKLDLGIGIGSAMRSYSGEFFTSLVLGGQYSRINAGIDGLRLENWDGAAYAEGLRLRSNNVGLGTNTPQARLHVIGDNTTSNILTLGVTNADLKARVDTNGNVFANKYYGDGSTLSGIGAASTNVAMISAGWVEAGGGHFTNDLSVDGTMRVNTLNVGTLMVTSCPAFTVGNLNVVTNANVATLTASNNATFLAGATFVTAVTSSADSASNAPAANEFPNASWVRGLFNNGAILYAGPGVRTDATNDSSGQFMYLFTNTIPATSSRKYAIPNAGDYVGGVMTSNALTFVQGPIYVHAFLQSSNGNGGQSISVHPEIYYSYDRTNWQGDFSANDQVIATGTNLYEWVISFPAITSTNSIGFWIERRFKVGAATGATHPDLYFHLGTNFASGINDASHISFSGPSSGTGNAYLANDQTFTGSNTFNGAINAASNINANRITATNRLTIGPTGTGTTFSNNAGILTIRDVAGQTVGVIDNDATLGTAFWIISTPTSNSMAAAITADTNKAAMAIGGGHLTNKMTVDGNIEFTAGLLDGGAQHTNYTLIAGTNTVYIGGGYSNVHVVAIMGGVAGRAIPMTIIITNGAGSEGHISFSPVTNAWHWPYSQGAPSVLTNNVQWVINLILDNTNVLAAWAAYAWP